MKTAFHPQSPSRGIMPSVRDPKTNRFLPTGRVRCKNHPEKKAHGNELCANCWSQDQRDRDTPYAQKQRESAREWQRKHSKTWQREKYKQNPEKHRQEKREYWAKLSAEERWEINLKSAYGIMAAEYYAILDRQNGCCGVCLKPPTDNKKLFVDHVHAAEFVEIRGLLCGRCNTLVGYIDKTNKENLERAINYASRVPIAKTTVRHRRARTRQTLYEEQEPSHAPT
jgi:hypothetical protein